MAENPEEVLPIDEGDQNAVVAQIVPPPQNVDEDVAKGPADGTGPFSAQWEESDVVLFVEGRKLHVHSMILSMASPTLKKLISKNREVDLNGKAYDLIEAMLQIIYPHFFYTFAGKSIDFLKDLLQLSQDYQITSIITKIKDHVDILCKDLTLHGETDQLQALQLLTLSDAGDFVEAIKTCATFIGPHLYYVQVACTKLKNYNGTFKLFCEDNPTLQIKTKMNLVGEIMKHKLTNVADPGCVDDLKAIATYLSDFTE